LITVICTIIQVLRMKREEHVLAEAFPEYERYANRRARLVPGIY
jgi:protein-S-isoprenylcysteine O-methyltransferase Ste14